MQHATQFFLWTGFALLLCGCAGQRASNSSERAAAAQNTPAPTAVTTPGTHALFDGKTLTGWVATDFAGRGPVVVTNGELHLKNGYMTGITWTSAVPRVNYEISLEAKRTEGSDFFCGLTFPVGTNYASFIVGGWGGGTVGISSIDGEDASQNETTSHMNFTNDKWYRIRLRVTPERIAAWIDDDQVVNLETANKSFSIRIEVEASTPLGIATWNTGAALRNIQLKTLN